MLGFFRREERVWATGGRSFAEGGTGSTGVTTTTSFPGFEQIVNRGGWWHYHLRLGHPWLCLVVESGKDDIWLRVRATVWLFDVGFCLWTRAATQ